MTKKEKKEMALRLKAEIESKKFKEEGKEIFSQEQKEKNNHRRHLLDKAKNRKGAKIFKHKNKNHWDFEKW